VIEVIETIIICGGVVVEGIVVDVMVRGQLRGWSESRESRGWKGNRDAEKKQLG
jgi:hypothetical protein